MKQDNTAILLVEDDYIDIIDFQRTFKKLNINRTIYIAHNGKEALEKLYARDEKKLNPFPSTIYLDLNMPKMNGVEFLQILRQDPEMKNLKVYILTTSSEKIDRQAVEQLGISGYITKPFFKSAAQNFDIEY
jgi:CheY-like chemotaxis protein